MRQVNSNHLAIKHFITPHFITHDHKNAIESIRPFKSCNFLFCMIHNASQFKIAPLLVNKFVDNDQQEIKIAFGGLFNQSQAF